MLQRIEKASATSEIARVTKLLDKQTSLVKREILEALEIIQSPQITQDVRYALEAYQYERVLEIIDAHVRRLGTGVILRVFLAVAAEEAGVWKDELDTLGDPTIAIGFNPTHPRAQRLMEESTLRFIREITKSQREATRAALVDAVRRGEGPIAAARTFRDSIGLTLRQQKAVANYRRLLELRDAEALTRGLRDRRFDRSVRRAVNEGVPLGSKRIATMVDRYRKKFVQYRAETIARTETIRVLNQARDEATRQMIEETGMNPDDIIRVWRSTRDQRTRYTHRWDTHRSLDGQRRKIGEPFVSPSGAQLMYPGDAGAPAEEVINCRCVLTIEVKPPEGAPKETPFRPMLTKSVVPNKRAAPGISKGKVRVRLGKRARPVVRKR